jgi:hypothetical protein
MILNLEKTVIIMAIYDVIRLIVMQFVTQAVVALTTSQVSFWDPVFIQTTIYLSIGLLIFWLFVYKNVPVSELVSQLYQKDIKDTEQ